MPNSDKQNSILEAASNLFAQKGFEEATISEIAKAAGIADSILYEYFKGKEEVLFNIPIKKTISFVQDLNEHLKGIKGADNKLRKLIWHYLNFHQDNKDYATLVLFELRPNRRFYASPAYESFREYNKILIDILKEGQEEAVFRNNINIFLIRNMILGAIDHIIYSWLLFERPKSIVDQADSLFELAHNALEPSFHKRFFLKTESEIAFDKTQAILKAAETLFAQKGFYRSTISDIAGFIGIGEATIYEYFQNKEDILFSIPMKRSHSLIETSSSCLQKSANAEVKFRKFIEVYLSFLQENKDYAAVLLLELRPNRRFYGSEAYQFLKQYSDMLMKILLEGQEEGTFQKNINVHIFRNMVFGAIDHLVLTWILFNKPVTLLCQADDLILLLFNAIKI